MMTPRCETSRCKEDGPDDVLTHQHQDALLFDRFYLVVTGFWLISEAMRFAKICRYPRQTDEDKVWGQIDALWRSPGRPLNEVFQMIEVYDFAYNYLTRYLHYASAEAFTRWREGVGMGEAQTVEEDWYHFDFGGRDAPTPPDIIEMFVLTSRWRRVPGLEWAPDEKSKYLGLRSFFDTFFQGQVEIVDHPGSPDTAYTTRHLEGALQAGLCAHTSLSLDEVHDKWIHYRKNKWNTEARGKALVWATSDEVVAGSILDVS